MAPRSPRTKSAKRKSKVVKLNAALPQQDQKTIQQMFEVQTKTTITTTNIFASASPSNVEINITQTAQEHTAISKQAVVSEKREIADVDAGELMEEASPRKKQRTLSNYSNPAGRTRSQRKALEQILDDGQDIDSILNDTQYMVKSEEIAKQIEEQTISDPLPDNDVLSEDDNVFAAITEKEAMQIAIKGEEQEPEVKIRLGRKAKDAAVAKIAQQSTLDGVVVKQEPHPPSKTKPWKEIRLKYMQGSVFRMSPELVRAFEIEPRLIRNDKLTVKRHAPFWDNADLLIKFGVSPYVKRTEPTPAQCQTVWNILDAWLRTRDPPIIIQAVGTTGAQGPAHGNAGITVDCLVRTVMAQSTANGLALTVQSLVTRQFHYVVNGEEVRGVLPNYHAMRTASQEELEKAIQRGGLANGKARTIHNALNAVYDKNVKLTKAANGGQLPPGTQLGQEPNQPDFVPGMLSMDFLRDMSMVDIFNFIVSIGGIGHKTASCILEFNYGFPICAVDIHVNKMAKYLGWVPENFDELNTFKHLEGRIPDNLKHLLHQSFWHHSQLCKRCKCGLTPEQVNANQDGEAPEPCPLEHLVTRFKRKPAPPRKVAVVADKQAPKPFVPWKAFANAEEAAEEGYEILVVPHDDDFNSGSANVRVDRKWVWRGTVAAKVEEE